MSIQKILQVKDLLESRGWVVSDVDGNQSM